MTCEGNANFRMKGALTEEFHWCGVGHLEFSTQIFGKQAVGFPPNLKSSWLQPK
jgi:hypothetical protein